MTVKGPMMRELDKTCQGANPATIDASNDAWGRIATELSNTSEEFRQAVKFLQEAFSEVSYSGSAAVTAFKTSATALEARSAELAAAVEVLRVVSQRLEAAERDRAAYEASGPASHGPAPDPSSQKYAQSGYGVDTAQAVQNQKALAADRAAYAAEEAAIAAGEARAAHHIEQVNDGFVTADPKVRAITEDPNDKNGSSSTGGIGGAGSQAPYSYGSASKVREAEARKAQWRPEMTYPSGWGHELIAAENDTINTELAKNEPEWDHGTSQWINADGSPAESTQYASVETAEGLAPLAGGSSGAVALGVGVGGAALGAGIAKALAGKFGAANAARLANTATSAARTGAAPGSARTSSAAGRAGAAGRTGAVGSGQRSAGKSMTGAGSRAGMKGTGAGGAGGRTGSKKDDKARGKDQEFLEDTDEQWADPNGNNVLDPNADRRAWATYDPRTQNPDGTPKNS